MKKLALIILMVLGISGCACSGTCWTIKEDWVDFWNDPKGEVWKVIEQELADWE